MVTALPPDVGVPEIEPVLASSVSPGGRLPDLTDQLVAPTAPVACKASEKGTLSAALMLLSVVIFKVDGGGGGGGDPSPEDPPPHAESAHKAASRANSRSLRLTVLHPRKYQIVERCR